MKLTLSRTVIMLKIMDDGEVGRGFNYQPRHMSTSLLCGDKLVAAFLSGLQRQSTDGEEISADMAPDWVV